MTTHVAFLRAINLGKHRRLPMPHLKQTLAEAGFSDVETHLATGNVRLTTPEESRTTVERAIEEALAASCGFEVPTVVVSPSELASVCDEATALDVTAQRRYLTFLKDHAPADVAGELDAWDAPGEGARVLGRAVYWWIDHPNAAARMSNSRIEKRLGVATTRDLKVVRTLAERWGALDGPGQSEG